MRICYVCEQEIKGGVTFQTESPLPERDYHLKCLANVGLNYTKPIKSNEVDQ